LRAATLAQRLAHADLVARDDVKLDIFLAERTPALDRFRKVPRAYSQG
jgi:hypothetical protein